MSLDPPTYLNSLQNNIRARPIPWEGAVRAGNITDEQLKKIKSVDKVRKEQRKQTVEGDLKGFSTFLVGGEASRSVLDHASKRSDIVQYILVLAGDLINGAYLATKLRGNLYVLKSVRKDIPSFASALLEQADPYKPFLPLLNQSSNPEDPIPLLTSALLTSLISASLVSSPKPISRDGAALPKLYSYFAILAQNQDSGLQDISVQNYSALLRTKQSRKVFWQKRDETLTPLVDILRAAVLGKDSDSTLWSGATSIRTEAGLGGGVGLQLLYHVLLVIWQLSFEGALVGDDLEKYMFQCHCHFEC